MLNKILFACSIFVFFVMSSNSVCAQDREAQQHRLYLLSAEKVNIQENCAKDFQDELRLEITMRFKLQNVSNEVLLLWKGEDGVFEPMYVGQTVSSSEGFAKSDVLRDSIGGESIAVGPKWEKLRNQLDAPAPPSGAILSIKPAEFVYFESRVFLIARTPFRGMTGGDIDLDRLKESDGVWLKTKFQVWSRNLNPRTNVQKRPLFSEILKDRWRPFGYLILEDLISEPIYLDLGILKKSGRCI